VCVCGECWPVAPRLSYDTVVIDIVFVCLIPLVIDYASLVWWIKGNWGQNKEKEEDEKEGSCAVRVKDQLKGEGLRW
jgi:hypothetical protein